MTTDDNRGDHSVSDGQYLGTCVKDSLSGLTVPILEVRNLKHGAGSDRWDDLPEAKSKGVAGLGVFVETGPVLS